MPKKLPIAAAERMAKEHGLQQVILLAWDGERTHVVTYGTTAQDCDQAAQGGDLMKKTMGWPDHKVFPSRIQALQKKITKLEKELAKLRGT